MKVNDRSAVQRRDPGPTRNRVWGGQNDRFRNTPAQSLGGALFDQHIPSKILLVLLWACVACCLLPLKVAGQVQAPNVLQNGSFELGEFTPGPIYGMILTNGDSRLAGWTVGGAGVGLRWFSPQDLSIPAADGDYHLNFGFLNEGPGAWISQTFHTVVGMVYEVSYQVGEWGNETCCVSLEASVTASGGDLLANQTAVAPVHLSYGPIQSFSFTANTDTTTLTFTDTATAGYMIDITLDNVSVRPNCTNCLVMVDGEKVLQSPVYHRGAAEVSLVAPYADPWIFFTLDGSDPLVDGYLYWGPFTVDQPVVVRAVAYNDDFNEWTEGEPIEIIPLPTITATTPGGGTVTIDPPDGAYLEGNRAIVTATPNAGWTFLQWLGDAAGTNPTVELVMNSNKTVQALFGTAITTATIGSGSVRVDPVMAQYPYGSIVRLTAVPRPGRYFVEWAGALSDARNPLDLVVTNGNPRLTAVFALAPTGRVTLTVVPSGCGRVYVSPSTNLYALGDTVTLTAVPDEHQQFLGWGGDASGVASSLTLTLTSNLVVEARFTASVRVCQAAMLEGGQCQLGITGAKGAYFVIEATTDFETWTMLAMVPNADGTVHFTDPDSTTIPHRFYRVWPLRMYPYFGVVEIPGMVWIPPGTFLMGSPETEAEREADEGPLTTVTISQGFWMGVHEVTQREHIAVRGFNPSYNTSDLNNPVEQVDWYDAVAYCEALTTQERSAGKLPAGFVYRLPTEAEWEYACRAGTRTAFHYGDELRSGMANFRGIKEYSASLGTIDNPVGIFLARSVPVESYEPNAWGLYDMHGNLYEWVHDWYSPSLPGGSVTDPAGPATGSYPILRGAAHHDYGSACRSAQRAWADWIPRSYSGISVGFRVVLARPLQ